MINVHTLLASGKIGDTRLFWCKLFAKILFTFARGCGYNSFFQSGYLFRRRSTLLRFTQLSQRRFNSTTLRITRHKTAFLHTHLGRSLAGNARLTLLGGTLCGLLPGTLDGGCHLLHQFLTSCAHQFLFTLFHNGLRLLLHLHLDVTGGSFFLGLQLLKRQEVNKTA